MMQVKTFEFNSFGNHFESKTADYCPQVLNQTHFPWFISIKVTLGIFSRDISLFDQLLSEKNVSFFFLQDVFGVK